MKLQSRIIVVSLFLIIIPLLIMMHLINREVNDRLSADYERRVQAKATETLAKIASENDSIQRRLKILKERMIDDNRFRLSAVDNVLEEQHYLRDYAEQAMALMGLSMLEIQDHNGEILSSGHFPGEFHCAAEITSEAWSGTKSETPYAFDVDQMFLAQVRRPEEHFLAWVCHDSLQIGEKRFTILGGVELDQSLLFQLSPQGDLAVSMIYPNAVVSSSEAMEKVLVGRSYFEHDSLFVALPEEEFSTRQANLPFLVPGAANVPSVTKAILLVSCTREALRRFLVDLRLWFLWVTLAAGAGSMILALWMSFRISRPLVDLAKQTEQIELEGYYGGFETRRSDEVGTLARLLDRLSRRLQVSASNLREVEHRATLGDMARQVNHDIKNGLVPMRNVFRHLSQEALDNPSSVGAIFKERKHVIEESIGYLEALAANYARISRRPAQVQCDVSRTISQVVSAMNGYPGVVIDLRDDSEHSSVLADSISLRRVVENILRNACDSMRKTGGRIEIKMDNRVDDNGKPGLCIDISDDGPGIEPESLAHVFDDFYTTRDEGAGLGLSIVRRLVTDINGSVKAANRPGGGASFTVWLPVHGHAEENVSVASKESGLANTRGSE